MTPKFHTLKEASELLGISKRTIRRAVDAGQLPCVKYNSRTWRLTAVDLAAWYASRGGRVATTRPSDTTAATQ